MKKHNKEYNFSSVHVIKNIQDKLSVVEGEDWILERKMTFTIK